MGADLGLGHVVPEAEGEDQPIPFGQLPDEGLDRLDVVDLAVGGVVVAQALRPGSAAVVVLGRRRVEEAAE